MGRFLSWWPWVVSVAALVFMVSLELQAQEPADPSKEIAALKQQVAQLQQPKPLSPAEQTKAAQDGYSAIFKEAKEKAGPACKAVQGRLKVTVASDGKASVSCEM